MSTTQTEKSVGRASSGRCRGSSVRYREEIAPALREEFS